MNLLAYIQGKRKGKEAHRIEKEAMRDPFLADALEGYDEVKADHAERIAHIRSRLPLTSSRSGQQKIYIGIAASLMLCLTVGGYFLLNRKTDSLIALSESPVTRVYEEEIEMTAMSETHPPSPNLAERERTAELQDSKDVHENVSQIIPPPPAQAIVSSAEMISEFVVVEDNMEIQAEADMEMIAQQAAEVVLEAAIVSLRKTVEDTVLVAFRSEAAVADGRARMASGANRSDLAKENPPMPEPQIGMEAYKKYLQETMNPLKKDECGQTTGVVEVEFKLKDGKPYDFVITQSFCDTADKEAIRLIENGCPWIGEDDRKVVLKVVFD